MTTSSFVSSVNKGGGKIPKFLVVVLVLIVVVAGVVGVILFQGTGKKTPAPIKTPIVSPKPAETVAPIPELNLVSQVSKVVQFPMTGELRVYYMAAAWPNIGIILSGPAGDDVIKIPAGAPVDVARIVDTGYLLDGPTAVTINSYMLEDSSKMSIGWAMPVNNSCGFNGFGQVSIASMLAFATAKANGEPIVSVQCWADYSPNPNDTSALDFNDYFLIWSYVPTGTVASPSPSVLPTPSPSDVVATPTPTPTATATPIASVRVTTIDTSEGVPVTGVVEDTFKAIGVGIGLLLLGLLVL